MKHRTRLALAGLLSASALTIAACGGAAGNGGSAGQGNADKKGSEAAQKDSGTAGMDHSQTDHGSGGAASGMEARDGRYSDERFIDEMVPHHRNAVDMAEVALDNAEHEEVEELAENIVSTQEAEIEELRSIKREAFGTSKIPAEMDMGPMDGMGMMNPGQLANERPFDRAFIDAMIPHHESAVEMAGVAREKSDNPRVRELAQEIVGAQEREISRMRSWRQEWYSEG